ncbi:MAG: YkgJ family cysteine cluster protein [Deltaproteobacteria bacterium]|nr:YkgJ family cysteine cluster protein [Deltaproteobacteria bacterium]
MNANNTAVTPASWDKETLEKNWEDHIESLASKDKLGLSTTRLRFQAEQGSSYANARDQWADMDEEKRVQMWEHLLKTSEESTQEIMPVCVQCGECCLKGSPTLMVDDLEILREEKIRWSDLVTLRQGEPARSPFSGDVFYLTEERIKLREKKGTKTCVFFDEETHNCSIHLDRPIQCRAQACWDEENARALLDEEFMTRKHLLEGVEVLTDLLATHDKRCSFEKLRDAFEQLKQTEGKSVDEVIDVLAFEDHFRHFVAEKLDIPEDTLDLIFGRSLVERVRLFGFRVEVGEDGARTLLPDKDQKL